MKYIIFDLEWNQPFSKGQMINKPIRFSGEIIQIGAVKTDERFEVEDTFDVMVRPIYYTKMNPKVKKLTGIDNEALMGGMGFL